MDPYDLKESFENGHRLVNPVLNAEMKKGDYFSIHSELMIYVNSMITTTYPDIVEVGPSNSCLCMSLSSDNWIVQDLPEAEE